MGDLNAIRSQYHVNLTKVDQNFAHGVGLKLRLSREARSRRADLVERHHEFRLSIAEQSCKRHPGLTLEKA